MTDAALASRRRRSLAVSRAAVVSRTSIPVFLCLAGALLGFGWLAFLLLRRAEGLATLAFDQAFFQQVVWNVSKGHGFVSSFNDGSFLGLHFSPLLAVPALIETVWADARVLSVLHALALASAGPAAFFFLRAAYRPSPSAPWLAAAIAAPLPIWSAVQEAGRSDFHTESLALPFALLAGWAGLRGRPLLLLAFAGVVLLAKEDQGFTVFVVGALIVARGPGRLRDGFRPVAGVRAVGLVVMAVGGLWSTVVFTVVMPLLRDGARLETGWYYEWIAQNGGPLANAERIGAQLSNAGAWMVPLGLLLSTAALGLLRPAWLLLALPPVLANLLSANLAQADFKLHYTLLSMVPILVAAAIGGRALLAWTARRRRFADGEAGRRPLGAALLLLAIPALLVAWFGGGLPPTERTAPGQWDRLAAHDALLRFAEQIPSAAVLAVDDGLAPPLASRADIRLIPNGAPDSWVLVDRLARDPGYFSWARRTAFVEELPASGRPLVAREGRFELWGPLDE
ncbi:MAG: DUF2079 domain-containing protein [Chloroflexota bacterium]|nr:DUF2079 domain-containing protein [Chloroflexota bacterium]